MTDPLQLHVMLAEERVKTARLHRPTRARTEEENKVYRKNAKKALVGGIGGAAAHGGNKLLLDRLNKLSLERVGDPLPVMQSLADKSPVPIAIDTEHIDPSMSGFARGTKDYPSHVRLVHTLNEPGILAHEQGHADIHGHPLGRLVQNKATGWLGNNAEYLGLASGALSGMSDKRWAHIAGVAAPAALSLPQLGYEAGASLLGMKRMRAAGANPAQLAHAAKTLRNAFGTYAMRAGGGTLNAVAAQSATNNIKHEMQRAHEEATPVPTMPKVAAGFATNAYSGAMNPTILTGASDLPPMTVQDLRAPVQRKKIAASAPTRGNFMMASDIPAFIVPDLRSPVQGKTGEVKEKAADVSPSVPWRGGGGPGHRQESDIPSLPTPSLAAPLRKTGSISPFKAAQTAKTIGTFKPGGMPKVPGPSIKDISKPRGSGFGTGIAGAMKNTIGGTAPVDLSTSPGKMK